MKKKEIIRNSIFLPPPSSRSLILAHSRCNVNSLENCFFFNIKHFYALCSYLSLWKIIRYGKKTVFRIYSLLKQDIGSILLKLTIDTSKNAIITSYCYKLAVDGGNYDNGSYSPNIGPITFSKVQFDSIPKFIKLVQTNKYTGRFILAFFILLALDRGFHHVIVKSILQSYPGHCLPVLQYSFKSDQSLRKVNTQT